MAESVDLRRPRFDPVFRAWAAGLGWNLDQLSDKQLVPIRAAFEQESRHGIDLAGCGLTLRAVPAGAKALRGVTR